MRENENSLGKEPEFVEVVQTASDKSCAEAGIVLSFPLGYFRGWSVYQGISSIWKFWKWPELRFITCGNAVLLGLFCWLGFKQLMRLKPALAPLSNLNNWVQFIVCFTAFCALGFILDAAFQIIISDQNLASELAWSWASVIGLALIFMKDSFKPKPEKRRI